MRIRNTFIAAGLAVLSGPAFADTVTLSNILSFWQNAVPVVGITIANGSPTSSARWGTGVPIPANQSGYDFTPVTPSVDFDVIPPGSSGAENLGLFNHLNFPITGITLQSIQLRITADISITVGANPPVNEGNHAFLFNFTHEETPNQSNPCAHGGANGQGVNINGCADQVTIAFNPQSESFTVEGIQYTLDILGFFANGVLTDQFLTVENSNNEANLLAIVRTTTVQVPEPGSLALVGLALLGVAGIMRRKSSR